MKLAILCFPGFGGSGVVASELAAALASTGDEVHVLSSARPVRLPEDSDRLRFHEVHALEYPVFDTPPYTLALAGTLAEVVEAHDIELVHLHYAVPHAASALIAKSLIAPRPLKIVTTLHGTDVTRVGSDSSFARTTRFTVDRSDAITAVSSALKAQATSSLGISKPIRVVPNFVMPGFGNRIGSPTPTPRLVHVSNFRPVKRSLDVVEVFARVHPGRNRRLLLVGEGPDLEKAKERARTLGVEPWVDFRPPQADIEDFLRPGDVFLLPSEEESFGLAALEAQACGLPVVASRVGGLPEVIADQETGILCPAGDLEAMATAVLSLLSDDEQRRTMGERASARALDLFRMEHTLDGYRAVYQQVLEPALA